MNVYLGNLTVEQIQERLGTVFEPEDIERLKKTYSDDASVAGKDKWHCFEIPFAIVCGSTETAENVVGILKNYAGKFTRRVAIEVSSK
jgi:uncharacterized protein YlxP (DUF503 family)